jgi:hypothetical protein
MNVQRQHSIIIACNAWSGSHFSNSPILKNCDSDCDDLTRQQFMSMVPVVIQCSVTDHNNVRMNHQSIHVVFIMRDIRWRSSTLKRIISMLHFTSDHSRDRQSARDAFVPSSFKEICSVEQRHIWLDASECHNNIWLDSPGCLVTDWGFPDQEIRSVQNGEIKTSFSHVSDGWQSYSHWRNSPNSRRLYLWANLIRLLHFSAIVEISIRWIVFLSCRRFLLNESHSFRTHYSDHSFFEN